MGITYLGDPERGDEEIRRNAERFSVARFKRELGDFIEDRWREFAAGGESLLKVDDLRRFA